MSFSDYVTTKTTMVDHRTQNGFQQSVHLLTFTLKPVTYFVCHFFSPGLTSHQINPVYTSLPRYFYRYSPFVQGLF